VSAPPPSPKIYHITHVDNLASIVRDGGLWSDAQVAARGGAQATIGMGSIKERRLHLPVRCHPGDCVGDYVPYYFCPRSIMLYVLRMGNHEELTYRGGQGPIVHLELDLHETIAWADAQACRWVFSLSNAGAVYTEFRSRVGDLGEIDWEAVEARDFRDPSVKEGKQAEFLLRGFAPWGLVRRIGVISASMRERVALQLTGAEHRPAIEVMRAWYF
jgi:hypothetical protein